MLFVVLNWFLVWWRVLFGLVWVCVLCVIERGWMSVCCLIGWVFVAWLVVDVWWVLDFWDAYYVLRLLVGVCVVVCLGVIWMVGWQVW